MTLFCRKSPLYDTFLYVNVRFMTHYLYVSAYNLQQYCKNKFIVLHFVLCKVLSLLKQNTI